MFWTIVMILIVMWLLGLVSGMMIGGWAHVLLFAAVTMLLVRLVSSRIVL